MDAGVVAEIGPPSELLNMPDGIFAKLWERQNLSINSDQNEVIT
jgi:ABC-type multidrug transport system fused ATPase/permease subunit